MKSRLALIILIALLTSFRDGGKTIAVNDLRQSGIRLYNDPSTGGHLEGDVVVNRVIAKGEGANARQDTLDLYDIHFFKNYKGRLKNYLLIWNDRNDYSQATYKWINDSMVSVTLIDGVTSRQFQSLHILQVGDKAVLDNRVYKD